MLSSIKQIYTLEMFEGEIEANESYFAGTRRKIICKCNGYIIV